jgi:DNA-binding response OmpR family regulator
LKEFKILALLAQNPNMVFSLAHIYDLIWGADNIGDTRTVMVHISNLRKKIELDPSNPKLIVTIKGAGYKLNAPL